MKIDLKREKEYSDEFHYVLVVEDKEFKLNQNDFDELKELILDRC